MSVGIGDYDGCPILRHEIRRFGWSEAVAVTVQVTDAYGETQEGVCKIWLTEKAMRMARAQLKACGFNIDTQHLFDLQDNHELLAGNKVSVTVDEDRKYGLQFSIALGHVTKKAADALTRKLRSAKADGDGESTPAATDEGPMPWDEPKQETAPAEPPKTRRDINQQNAVETAEAQATGGDIPF